MDELEKEYQKILAGAPTDVDATRISVDQMLFFNRQLASMARLNLPLALGLKSLAKEVKSEKFRAVIASVQQDMEQGVPLQEALAKYPNIFSDMYIEVIKAGESTGNLAEVLEELAVYSEEMHDVRTKIIQALAYPAFVSFVSVILIGYILLFAVPQFKLMFMKEGELRKGLGATTVMVIKASDFVHQPAIALPLAAGIIAAASLLIFRMRKALERYDQFLFNLPFFGKLFFEVTLFKICRTLGDLLRSGVSIIEALSFTARTAGNNDLRLVLQNMKESVENGERMSDEMRKSSAFPETMVWKLSMGEERGVLEEALEELSGYYQREVAGTAAKITTLLEPILLLGLALIVGFLVMSLYIPLFSMHRPGA